MSKKKKRKLTFHGPTNRINPEIRIYSETDKKHVSGYFIRDEEKIMEDFRKKEAEAILMCSPGDEVQCNTGGLMGLIERGNKESQDLKKEPKAKTPNPSHAMQITMYLGSESLDVWLKMLDEYAKLLIIHGRRHH